MPAALPYAFETSATPQLILRGVCGLLLVAVVGVVYSLLVSRNVVAVGILAVVGLMAAVFFLIVARRLEATTGVITSERVDVRRARFLGVPLHGPHGSYPIAAFSRVQFAELPGRVDVFGESGRVSLIGREGTPDVLIARTGEEGKALARDLAAATGLPFEATHVPY